MSPGHSARVKRYKGTYELILYTDSEKDKLGDKDTKEDREDKSSDTNDKRERERSEDEGPNVEGGRRRLYLKVPSTFEVGQSSRSVPEQQGEERGLDDNGTEFKNSVMNQFCDMKRIKREFSVAERKNKTLIEAARTMALVIKPHNKTPYELIRGRPPLIDFMKPFGKQTNGIAGTKDNIVTGQDKKTKEPEQEYILIPIYTTDPLISQGPKDSVVDAGKI
nr:hypothetical protein [Tanacetum cinerariifolium]